MPALTDIKDNLMLINWRRFSSIMEGWIPTHGMKSGYDRNGGDWNVAEVWRHPMGWAQDGGKYCMELYEKCMADPEEWDEDELRELCFKISHCGQIAFSRVLSMRSPERSESLSNPDAPRPDFYGPTEPLK